MSQINRKAFAALRQRTCAIGVLKVSVDEYIKDPEDPKFKIFGTGFLIAPQLVITNRHVIRSLLTFVENESLPNDRRHVAFLRPDGHQVQQSFHEFEKVAMLTEPNDWDVGLIAFRAAPDDPIRAVAPVEVPDAFECEVGDPIGVYGYAFGENLLKREVGTQERLYRFGPVLQQGYISGIAPYDHAQHVSRLLLDVRTSRGMSGSPVFDPRSGLVHALHTSGIEDTVAFAIPITASTVASLIEIAQHSPGDRGTSVVKNAGRAIPK